MFSRAVGRIIGAFRGSGENRQIHEQEIADALCKDTQQLSHKGPLSLSVPAVVRDRAYSPHSGAENLHPVPPLDEYAPTGSETASPAGEGALLNLRVASYGNSRDRGEEQPAINVDGIAKFPGPLWGVKHFTVDSVGEVADTRTSDAYVGTDDPYYVADGYKCNDERGRGLTDTPIRVFYSSAAARPVAGECGRYIHDTPHGKPTGLAHGSPLRWCKANTGWAWVSGYSSHVGEVTVVDVDDLYGNNPGTCTSRLYMRSTSALDPNAQVDDVIGYSVDENNLRVAIHGGLDAKIGSVKIWNLSVASIPGGWVEDVDQGGFFPVGRKEGDPDYSTSFNVGGNHPMRPRAHEDTEPEITTSSWTSERGWVIGVYEGTTDWYETAWRLDDLPEKETEDSPTGISVVSTNLSVTSSQVSVVIGAGTGSVGSTSLSIGSTSLTIQAASITINAASGTSGSTTLGLEGSPSCGNAHLDPVEVCSSTDLQIIGSIQCLPAGPEVLGDITVQATGLAIVGYATTNITTVEVKVDDHGDHRHNIDVCLCKYDLLDPDSGWFHWRNTDTSLTATAGAIKMDEFAATTLSHATVYCPHLHTIEDNYEISPENHSHGCTHSLSMSSHTHTITDSLAITPNPHSHAVVVTIADHSHSVGIGSLAVTPATHSHSVGSHTHSADTHTHGLTPNPHGHSIDPNPHDHPAGAHTHSVTVTQHHHDILPDPHGHPISDPEHHHLITAYSIDGSLYHREEDFRPPYRTRIYIRRASPDED